MEHRDDPLTSLTRSTPEEQAPAGTSPLTDTDFMREKIKQRPVNRRKLLRRTALTVSLAIVFGLVSCLTFLLLEPVFNRALNPETEPVPNPVILPEAPAEEEVAPEDLIARDAEMEREEETDVLDVIDNYVFDVSDYNEMYASLKSLAAEAVSGVVTVTAVTSGTDWISDSYERSGTVSGVIVADNGYDLLILTDHAPLAEAEEILVTFAGDTTLPAELLSFDADTGLCILKVADELFTEEQRETITIAALGTSLGPAVSGSPVIALGSPAGTPDSVVYGMVTSNTRTLSLTDAGYALLTTNIVGAASSSGVLCNTRGEVLGFFTPSLTERLGQEPAGLICAYGVSGLRRLVERLSNNRPRALLGVYGTEVPAKVREREEMPQGAYISRIAQGSPAMSAGIQSGDILIRLNDTEITNFNLLAPALAELLPEDEVQVTLMRQGPEGYTEMEVSLTLGEG